MAFTGRQLHTTLSAAGVLTVEIVDHEWAAPNGTQVLVQVEATPINPSDLALLFGPADTANARYSPGKVVAQMPEAAVAAMSARHGISMPAGNEAAGPVVAAGQDPSAQALLGKRVACVPGTAYATFAYAEAAMTLPLPDDVSTEQGASSFVNPMTALGFVETMRIEGFTGLVHAAAASNLGQMLVRVCHARSGAVGQHRAQPRTGEAAGGSRRHPRAQFDRPALQGPADRGDQPDHGDARLRPDRRRQHRQPESSLRWKPQRARARPTRATARQRPRRSTSTAGSIPARRSSPARSG